MTLATQFITNGRENISVSFFKGSIEKTVKVWLVHGCLNQVRELWAR